MSLKQVIRRSKIVHKAQYSEMTLPGEPLIYSIKYPLSNRIYGRRFFRNKQYRSLLKCSFANYTNRKVPVAIIVKFYVSPPAEQKITREELRSEKFPAVLAFEVTDYWLSFIEMLFHALFMSYKQIVKIDAMKLYSHNPRTVFQYMRYDHYVELQDINTANAKAESERKAAKNLLVQSKRRGDEIDQGNSDRSPRQKVPRKSATKRPDTSSSALRHGSPEELVGSQEKENAPNKPHKET